MCSPTRCADCGKVTWTGCGMHAKDVLSRFPESERCECARVPARPAQWYPRKASDLLR